MSRGFTSGHDVDRVVTLKAARLLCSQILDQVGVSFIVPVLGDVAVAREAIRVAFAIDVLECPRCQGPMKSLAQIHPPDTTRRILQCLALPARPPPIAVARPDRQASLPFDLDEAAPLD